MAGGGRCPRRCSWIRQRRRGSKQGVRGEGAGNIIAKPSSRSSGEWICVRGHRMRLRGRMRVDADGNVYVPDSEDEESGVEVERAGARLVDFGGSSAAANVGAPADSITIGADAGSRDGVNVTPGDVPTGAVDVAADEGVADDVKVEADMLTGEEMHPKVAARLKMLLADMDPALHDVFVSMYKMRTINIEINSMHNNMFIFLEMGLSFLNFI